MTDKLPPNLLALFAPRPPLRWLAAPDHAPEERKTTKITGLADYLPHLAAYKDNDGYVPTESWLQARDRKKLEKKQQQEKLLAEGPKNCELSSHQLMVQLDANTGPDNPAEDANVRGDPFKTLIVARLSYDANESDLEKEFGRFGPIERVRLRVFYHSLSSVSIVTDQSPDPHHHGYPRARAAQQEEEAPPRICFCCI